MPVRCYTRALKNARFLQQAAPQLFARDPDAEGFGTGIPLELLRGLHRIHHDSPVLRRHPHVSGFLKEHRLPVPARGARDALFSGTIHFAQLGFETSSGARVVPTADLNKIVAYARHAIVPISEYAAQYGPNQLRVSPTLLRKSVSVPSGAFRDRDLQGWVDALATANGLGADSAIFVVVPAGIRASEVSANAGYHARASIPYVVAGVFATGLTLTDKADVYAMVVSHEIAEMVVDPAVGGGDPEVCDPCDLNCGALTRCYFSAADEFLGSNQQSPPGGYRFSYYVCAVVKPDAASDCPASSANCGYAPGKARRARR